MSHWRRGLSLFEVLVVLAMIVIVTAFSLPMISMANDEARSAACKQNLSEIGTAIAIYAEQHQQMPVLFNGQQSDKSLTLQVFVSSRVTFPGVLLCPSDEGQLSRELGTSYRWSQAYNGLPLGGLNRVTNTPCLTDREAFHSSLAQPCNGLMVGTTDGQLIMRAQGVPSPPGAR